MGKPKKPKPVPTLAATISSTDSDPIVLSPADTEIFLEAMANAGRLSPEARAALRAAREERQKTRNDAGSES